MRSAMPLEINLFDGEEVHENCTVQILTNSITGETSVGWWENEGWIDVDNRLPEVGVDVLVYAIGKIDGFIGQSVMTITKMSDANRFWYGYKVDPYWVGPWQYFMTDYKITHWRPLPEAPKM